jgi:hypothetical protein
MIIHDRIRLTAIKHMKGAFGNEGALRFYAPAEIDVMTHLRYPLEVMPATLTRHRVERLQEAIRLRSEIDKLERKLVTLLNGVPRNLLVRNDYGFTAAEMSKIAQNLHGRAKERIALGQNKRFRGSIEKIV